MVINEYTKAEFAFWNSFFGNCKETKKSIADALAILRGEAYQDFFALWKDSDADIPILIEAKQEYEKVK